MRAQNSNVVVVSTAMSNLSQAERIARLLVAERLAACAQLIPIKSIYRWKGRVESAAEILLLAKTTKKQARSLMSFIRKRHSYELPEIVAFPVSIASRAYGDWVEQETKPVRSRKKCD